MPHSEMSNFTEKDVPDLTGYTAIVTGGNSGIGYEVTKHLALRNAKVYIASRSLERIQACIEELRQSTGRQLSLHALQMDLMDLRSVKAAATHFNSIEERLDLLINNAGVMSVPYSLTKDGFETQWQVNYVAPHVLTAALLPRLVATAALYADKSRVRVVNVASDLAFSGPKGIQFEDINMERVPCAGMMALQKRYGHSKQAIIRDAKEINDRYANQGVSAYSLHPGIVKSNLQSSDPSVMGKVIRVAMRFSPSTPLDGAYNTLWAATSREAYKSAGKFFMPVGQLDKRANEWLGDGEGNARLWEMAEETTRHL